MEWVLLAIAIGLIPAAAARSKGHSFLLWWFFGFALWIVAMPWSLMLKKDARKLERDQLAQGGRKCPSCAEIVKQEAVVCRYCNRDLPPLYPSAGPAPASPSAEPIA